MSQLFLVFGLWLWLLFYSTDFGPRLLENICIMEWECVRSGSPWFMPRRSLILSPVDAIKGEIQTIYNHHKWSQRVQNVWGIVRMATPTTPKNKPNQHTIKESKRRLAAKRILPLIVLKIDSFLVLLALLKWAADGPLCFGRDVLTQQLTFTRAAKMQEFMFDLCSNRIWKEDRIGKK